MYRQFYGAMMHICLRYSSNGQDATEILNNGFLKVFTRLDQYDPMRASLSTWIRNIMVHAAIDFLRAKHTSSQQTSFGEMEEDPAIESGVILKMNADELLELIRQLPATTQLVFNLHTVEGYSHPEIAAMLSITDSTSRWHLSEARKKLKQSIMNLQR